MVRRLLLLLVMVSSVASAGPKGDAMPMRKQDFVPPIFGPAMSVGDPGFDTWLETQGLVKLPFTIWRKPRRVGAIGVHESPPAKVLRFSDGALGIPLDERLRQLCADQDPCRVWLSGKRGESMPLPDPDPSSVFNVYAVHERVEGTGPHVAFTVRTPECLVIKSMKPIHCARGPGRCEKCKQAAAQPAVPKLLDLCPPGANEVARPTVEIVRDGKPQVRVFDVLRSFTDAAEAREFSARNGVAFDE